MNYCWHSFWNINYCNRKHDTIASKPTSRWFRQVKTFENLNCAQPKRITRSQMEIEQKLNFWVLYFDRWTWVWIRTQPIEFELKFVFCAFPLGKCTQSLIGWLKTNTYTTHTKASICIRMYCWCESFFCVPVESSHQCTKSLPQSLKSVENIDSWQSR